MENKEFDDIIKSKLNAIAEAPDARSWDLFTLAALEKGEDEIFDDKSTDLLVKGALDNFKIDYDANTWDALVNKMDKKEEDPILLQRKFDKEISNSLKSVTRKYEGGSWPKLAARIEQEEKYLRHYYRAKFVEACVFIFLILSLVKLGETGKLKLPLGEHINNIELALDQNNQTKSTNSSESKENKETQDLTQYNLQSNTEDKKYRLGKIVTVARENLSANTKYISEVFSLNQPTSVHYTESEEVAGRVKSLTQSGLTISVLANNDPALTIISFDERNLDKSIASISTVHAKTMHNKNLDLLSDDMNELYIPKRNFNIKKFKKAVAVGEWKLGAYTHFDYNEIYFPESKIALGELNTLHAYTAKSTGYGSGFKALYSKNRLGLEFGAGYSNKSYSPNREYNGSKEFRAFFNNIEYDIVELPIAVRYLSKANTRMRTFAQVGLNTNFIVKSFYDISTKALEVRVNPKEISKAEKYFSSRVTREFTKLDNSKVMAYAQGSLGLEWRLNSRVDLSSQLVFSQRILNKKFGDNFDQFKSLSLEVGLKTRL